MCQRFTSAGLFSRSMRHLNIPETIEKHKHNLIIYVVQTLWQLKKCNDLV